MRGQDARQPPGDDRVLVMIGLLTGLATLLGGALALRLKSSIGLLLGFGAGAVIGVGLRDLLPEALELSGGAHAPFTIATALAAGFAVYLVADQSIAAATPSPALRSHIGPATLTLHSLMDGLGIGLAFQVSATTGWIVAAAVLAHDLVDGANTVTLSLSGGAQGPTARRWLVADAIAPLIGIGLSRLIQVPPARLAILLAVFAGFFCYIGASELLPRARDRRPHLTTTFATVLGMAVIYAAVRFS
jgi:zinc transporter ZupT